MGMGNCGGRRTGKGGIEDFSFAKPKTCRLLVARRTPPARLSLDLEKPAAVVDTPEYSPLEAPRLPFSSRGYGRSSPTSSARTSSSSLSSLASSGSRRYSGSGGTAAVAGRSADSTAQQRRVELGNGSAGYGSNGTSPSASVRSLPRVDEDMAGYTYEDHDGAAQEELLDESERPVHHKGNGNLDPYAWERPLDAVNRHSRLLDVTPAPQNVRDSRRLSRLPPGVAMVDPFGFNVAAETSPYDLALTASQAPVSATLSSSAPSHPSRASYSGVPNVSAAPVASSSGYRASFMGAPPGLAENGSTAFAQPWTKQRASSHGELGTNGFGQPRAQVRNSLLSPNAAMRATSPKPGAGPSKLSGEVDLGTPLSPSSKRQSIAPPIPTDADYLNSRLYQRTLKAQKAVEKERAKAAAKGRTSRYDTNNLASKSTSSLTSTLGGLGMRKRSGESLRPASIMSVAGVSGSSSIRRSGRKSFGWFRSSSEAALPLSASTGSNAGEMPSMPTMPTSHSLPKMPANPTRTSSNGTSSSNGAASLLPTMPPSPNLPSEATLRAMGVSDDQITAAAQAQGTAPTATATTAGRPRLDGRQSSGERRASSRPGMSRESSAAQNPPMRSEQPPRPVSQPAQSLAPPPQQQQPNVHQLAPPIPAPVPAIVAPPAPQPSSAPPRSASRDALAPLVENSLEVPKTRGPSPVALQRNGPPPQSSSNMKAPQDAKNVPLPDSAPPSRQSVRPPAAPEAVPVQPSAPRPQQPAVLPSTARATEEPRRVSSMPQPQQAPSSPALVPVPTATQQEKPEYRRMASSSSSGGSRTPTTSDSLVVPGTSQAYASRPTDVKRRKSGFGALFGFGGGDKSARSASGSALSQSGRSHGPIAERNEDKPDDRPRQTLKRVEDRQREAPAPAQKLTRERANSTANDGGGHGLFGRGKPSRPEPSSRNPVPPSTKSAAPPAKAKKEAVPFYHPSQMLHAAEPEPARTTAPQLQSIRAINPSPHPSNGGRSFSGGNGAPEAASSAAGLNSSTSTFPPNRQTSSQPRQAPPPQPQQQQQQSQKKSAFSSLLSYGSVRSRTRSSPAVPASARFGGDEGGRGAPPPQQQQQQQNGFHTSAQHQKPSREQARGPEQPRNAPSTHFA
ncbi:hypothetical protein JCM10908_001010 [Rhodotorula pacifica]|uniref:uncharacterized protein n=1 Tax=Rhodotorula pacifica TaxID=1495444 RepID=UPI003177A8F8